MSETVQPQGVVFIASDVPDLQDLLNGLQPGEQAFVIDPSSDGLQQIADILAANNLTDLASISIVAHGASGELDIGASPLIDPDLAGNSNALAEIGAALASGGTIALYGCDVAEGAEGQQFINDFSALAGGVTVEASTQIVGNAALGGSWTLDAVSNGTAAPLSSSPPFTSSALDQYQGELLALPYGFHPNPPPFNPPPPPPPPPQGQVALTTTATGNADGTANDTAVLSGGNDPTGTITFTLVDPDGTTVDTEMVTVSGDGTYGTAAGYTLPDNAAIGVYQWDATYSGDANNASASDIGASAEQLSNKYEPTIVATPNVTTLRLSPVTLTDTAVLDGFNPTGTITFVLGGPEGTVLDRETVTVDGSGSYTTPTGFTLPSSGAEQGPYQWQAYYNGDALNDTAKDENDGANGVTVNQAFPTLSTTPNSTTVTLGSNPVTLTDTADLESGYDPTGSIIFTLDGPDGTTLDTETVAVNGNGTYATPTGFTLPDNAAIGTYQWDASYSGDADNINSSDDNDPAAEQVTVSEAEPTLSTTPGATAITLGLNPVTLTDTADLENGYNPTGAIIFTLAGPDGTTLDTETVTVNGNGTYATPTGFTLPDNAALGAYQWDASYSGDADNASLSDDNDSAAEQVTVSKTQPALSATPSATTVGLSANPVTLTDTANLENGLDPTGTITFLLGGPQGSVLDRETITVNGNGTYTTPTGFTLPSNGAELGPYQWQVDYNGDALNDTASDENDSAETVTVNAAFPTLSTTPNFTAVTLGSNPVTLTDTADLENGYSPTGSIIFTLDGPNGTTLDTETVAVNGNGTYATPAGYTLPDNAAPGTYQWDASYSGDADNINISDANDPDAEQVTVNAADPTLSATLAQGPDPNALQLIDTADLENGYNPTGTITFTLYGPDSNTTPLDTETVAVSGNGTYTTPTGYTLADDAPLGSYQWDATYSGDVNNTAVSDVNDPAEQAWIVAEPTLTTTPGQTTVTLGPNPVTLTDTADLENGYTGYDPTGSITFTLYGPDSSTTPLDTETVTVNGNGTYTTPTGFTLPDNAALGIYQWDASYDGDDSNDSASDVNDPAEQVTVDAPCYCRGTLIKSARGQKRVENLKIGDKVKTMSGALRPIKWIGRRSYSGRFVLGRKDVLPVCIRAGALGDNVPARDLWISPHHAMYFEDNGGVLIEAKDLLNGLSIVQAERIDNVEYFHIELDTHDVIVAEGSLSETFVDDGSRGMFHNARDFAALYPDTPIQPARYCAPRLELGFEVEAVRQRIAARAGLLRAADGQRIGALCGFVDHVEVDCIAGWAQTVDAPEAPVCLDVLAGGRLIGQVLANRYRDDLEQAGLGSGRHSFEFTPSAGVAFASDAVEVRRSIDGVALPMSAHIRRAQSPIAAKTVRIRASS